MKMFIAAALMVTSLSSFAAGVELRSYGEKKEFDQYYVSSDKAAKIVVGVDSEPVRVDCHGLSFLYTQNKLANGSILVTKEGLMHTMQMCSPGQDHVAQSGTQVTVEFTRSFGGTQLILVPAGAKVVIQ